MQPSVALAPLPNRYIPRDSEATVLHRACRQHVESFLLERQNKNRLPHYVEKEFHGYLQCGVFAKGFCRFRCVDCNHGLLVPFSCKKRGFCPSCTVRRSHDVAHHLVEDVLPQVPTRQWVLSFPRPIRFMMARDPGLLKKLLEIFNRTLESHLKSLTNQQGQMGAITFVQHFGSALNLNIHFHVLATDGVFTEEDGEVQFHKRSRLQDGELESFLLKVGQKILSEVAKHIHDDFDPDDEHVALLQEEFKRQSEAPKELFIQPAKRRDVANIEGFSLHAGVKIAANDKKARERLCGYGARGPLALSRLKERSDGKYEYEMRRAFGTKTKLVMTGPELLQKLSTLIPKPRVNLVRYSGVFAPNAKLRSKVIPKGEGTKFPFALPKRKKYRTDWMELLKRIHGADVSKCPKCGGKMKFVAQIKGQVAIKKILAHLGMRTEPLPTAPARAPPEPEWDLFPSA